MRISGASGRASYNGRQSGKAALHVLMVAHWTPRKGILDALRALSLASDNVTLDLVGETDRDLHYTEQVQATLAAAGLNGRVRLHGRVSSACLSTLYRSADALLLCSSHEGYGMVLAEGLAAGLPIVATRVGAVPEVVGTAGGAELVEPGDVVGLARALDRLASDGAERVRRSSLAREHATTLPTWSDSISAFDALLRRVARRG